MAIAKELRCVNFGVCCWMPHWMKASSPCHRLPQNLPLLSSTLLSSNPKMALPNQPSLLKTNSICDVVKSVEKFIPIIYIYSDGAKGKGTGQNRWRHVYIYYVFAVCAAHSICVGLHGKRGMCASTSGCGSCVIWAPTEKLSLQENLTKLQRN